MRLEDETMEELNRAETAWALLAPYGVHPDNADLERHAVYTFRGRWAQSWHHGRSILAGDAAHLMPPFLGEGFNSGVRDALGLAWQLDLVLQGVLPESVLDSYSSERLGHVRQIVSQAVELGRLICVTDPEEAALRDDRLRDPASHTPVARPEWRLGPGTWLEDDPHAGFLGVQGRIELDGQIGRFDDLVGGCFVLLGLDEDPATRLSPRHHDALARLGGRTAHFGANPGLTDVDGTYARWFAERDVRVALFRPDHYVFGTGSDPCDADGLVDQLVRRTGTVAGGED